MNAPPRKKTTNKQWIEETKRMFLDIHDKMTCAHEEDEATRKKNFVYPSIWRIKDEFKARGVNVSELVIRDIRRRLLETGEIPDLNYGNRCPKNARPPRNPLDPVEDDPEEVAKWSEILKNAKDYRIPPKDGSAIKGKSLVAVIQDRVIHHFYGPFKIEQYMDLVLE
jgi:hypothetical protein